MALLCSFHGGIGLTGSAVKAAEKKQHLDQLLTSFNAGDVNLNGETDILDVILMNKAVMGKETFSKLQNAVADVNRDEKIDSTDSLLILKHIVDVEEITIQYGTKYLNKSVEAQEAKGKEADQAFIKGQTEFYLNLFQKTEQEKPEENILVSPYSVMQVLAMTANGADGSTKAEMEQTLGGLPLNDLNKYLYTQRTNQPDDEQCKLTTANSIWYRDDADRLQVLPEFLQTNADYYEADAFSAPFDDTTVTDINSWVNWNTDGMIPELLGEIDGSAVMYLINAVAFDAKWKIPYDSEYEVHEREFTAEDGRVQTAEMLFSKNESLYLSDDHAEGFYKEYQGGKYAFAALLPEEGLSVDDYISGLSAESLQNTLTNPEHASLHTIMPKFSDDDDITLNNALYEMGMQEAFTEFADFSKMAGTASGILRISKVKHKTYISVTEEGTRAGAVSSVEMSDNGEKPDYIEITLNRPFVYMIVDMEYHLPIFMGAVKSIS